LVQGTKYTINLQGQQGNVGTLEDPYLRLHSSTGATLGERRHLGGLLRDSSLSSRRPRPAPTTSKPARTNDQYTGTYAVSVFSGTTDDFANSLTDTVHVLGQISSSAERHGSIEVVATATGSRFS